MFRYTDYLPKPTGDPRQDAEMYRRYMKAYKPETFENPYGTFTSEGYDWGRKRKADYADQVKANSRRFMRDSADANFAAREAAIQEEMRRQQSEISQRGFSEWLQEQPVGYQGETVGGPPATKKSDPKGADTKQTQWDQIYNALLQAGYKPYEAKGKVADYVGSGEQGLGATAAEGISRSLTASNAEAEEGKRLKGMTADERMSIQTALGAIKAPDDPNKPRYSLPQQQEAIRQLIQGGFSAPSLPDDIKQAIRTTLGIQDPAAKQALEKFRSSNPTGRGATGEAISWENEGLVQDPGYREGFKHGFDPASVPPGLPKSTGMIRGTVAPFAERYGADLAAAGLPPEQIRSGRPDQLLKFLDQRQMAQGIQDMQKRDEAKAQGLKESKAAQINQELIAAGIPPELVNAGPVTDAEYDRYLMEKEPNKPREEWRRGWSEPVQRTLPGPNPTEPWKDMEAYKTRKRGNQPVISSDSDQSGTRYDPYQGLIAMLTGAQAPTENTGEQPMISKVYETNPTPFQVPIIPDRLQWQGPPPAHTQQEMPSMNLGPENMEWQGQPPEYGLPQFLKDLWKYASYSSNP